MRFYPPLAFWKTCLALPRPRPWELLAIILGLVDALDRAREQFQVLSQFHHFPIPSSLQKFIPTFRLLESSCAAVTASLLLICCAPLYIDENPRLNGRCRLPPQTTNPSSTHIANISTAAVVVMAVTMACGAMDCVGGSGSGPPRVLRQRERERNVVPSWYTRSSHAIVTPVSLSSVSACYTRCTSTAAARLVQCRSFEIC